MNQKKGVALLFLMVWQHWKKVGVFLLNLESSKLSILFFNL